MPTVAKSSLTILMESSRQQHSLTNISRRNVIRNITDNSPSNILKNHCQFHSYCQKYHRSRRQLPEQLLSTSGLNIRCESLAILGLQFIHSQHCKCQHDVTIFLLFHPITQQDDLSNCKVHVFSHAIFNP